MVRKLLPEPPIEWRQIFLSQLRCPCWSQQRISRQLYILPRPVPPVHFYNSEEIWNNLLKVGNTKPAELGCRDTLRLESCYLLYGQDMDEDVSPLEAGIGWATKLQKGPFIGSEKIASQKEVGATRKSVAFKLTGKGIARSGMKVLKNGKEIGIVTSGTKLPTLGFAGGLALVENGLVTTGDNVEIDVRGKPQEAEIIKKPMYIGTVK